MPDPHFSNTPAYFKEIASGDTPSSGQVALYAKSDGKMYYKDDAGVETEVGGGGGGSITTSTTPPVSPSAGDLWFNSESGILYVYYDDGNSQQWVAADNSGSGGKVAQVVRSSTSISRTGTTVIPFDTTTPQNTEGTELLTVTITPTNSSSTLEFRFDGWCTVNAAMGVAIALFKDSDVNAIDATVITNVTSNYLIPLVFTTSVAAGSTSSQTYKIRIGIETAQFGSIWYFLRRSNVENMVNTKAWLTVREILP